ncbi:S-adenosylmethionine sensor upstream of mTORC1 [Teleopsis dalmanni]|uniref:S-adenosylmethionine sensor upstream of mTORC1 n=1 Tax=Teleopsis dalmanni TaxID=139649 RepID=UPI0018CE4A5B|nr:S-adenosylmethionine sensor upstream of mTORC1 [Teleopsis dalmanni]
MATEEHKLLAEKIKECHNYLRQLNQKYGTEQAWDIYLKDTVRLSEYAEAMKQLSTIWESNINSENRLSTHSRIKWVNDFCTEYFFTEGIYIKKRLREQHLLKMWLNETVDDNDFNSIPDRINLLDIGSCFNPFSSVPYFNVTAIDLCPATNSNVLQGNFLKINVGGNEMCIENNSVCSLPARSYDCVLFSLLLEYIPSPQQRLECCEKAYELLKTEGILIIITPDSQPVNKNACYMKNWRYTLATLGFLRIRFEKLQHITCLVFRKAIDLRIAKHWAQLHREDYMNVTIDIPQDRNILDS